MIRFRGKVAYTDGREEDFETGSAALQAWEDYALRHGYPVGEGMPGTLGALMVAHYALRIEAGFDAWRVTVDGIELEADGLPPTLPEPMAGS